MDKLNYQSGTASIFATLAREPKTAICGWCLESGDGTLIHIGDALVLDSHPECRHAAEQFFTPCTCLKREGDNSLCPKHGWKK
jgi:hypothetical protein